jgi:hypothetical protein
VEKVPEIIMHYNAYDKRYYIYAGRDTYLYDTQSKEQAIAQFNRWCAEMQFECDTPQT